MKKKMIHKLSVALAHTTPIDYKDMPLPKVIHSKGLFYGSWPNKENSSQKYLNPPNTLLREGSAIITNKDTIEGSNIEQLFFGEGPLPIMSRFN
jgi:hypothetical protein